MDDNKLLESLNDSNTFMEAYAASSAYVMRKVFAATKHLKEFTGREDLAPQIMNNCRRLTKQPQDPVILGAHLYALELTNSNKEIRAGVLNVLENKELLADPLIGQFAGEIGLKYTKLKKQIAPGAFIDTDELQELVRTLKKEEGK